MISVVGHLVGDRLKDMAEALWPGGTQEAADINASLLPVYTGMLPHPGRDPDQGGARACRACPPVRCGCPWSMRPTRSASLLRADLALGGVRGFTA